jgi:hypothetical protein
VGSIRKLEIYVIYMNILENLTTNNNLSNQRKVPKQPLDFNFSLNTL